MPKSLKVVDASRNPVLTGSSFKGYDACVNTYVGCQFGCSYCYVRFFVKDEDRPWGDFVRLRRHVADRLPRELEKARRGIRVVLGTMTDPYQPAERLHRLTRTALEILGASDRVSKVGIFTRSPIVEEDAELIASLPGARVHLSITPFPRESMLLVEKVPIVLRRRWQTVSRLVSAGVRVHVNVAPLVPVLSDGLASEFCRTIAASGASEFFVDPVQPYAQAVDAMRDGMSGDPRWPEIASVLADRKRFDAWKSERREEWLCAWREHGSPGVLAIWQDHARRTYEDMSTGAALDPRTYDSDPGRA